MPDTFSTEEKKGSLSSKQRKIKRVPPEAWNPATPEEMIQLGSTLLQRWKAGDIVFLHGNLGAGKTTLAKGIVKAAGYLGEVRSPTFTLLNPYPTNPPILHCDLYRVTSHHGLDIESYLDTHLVLIEWPDRAANLIDTDSVWNLTIEPQDEGRIVTLIPPK